VDIVRALRGQSKNGSIPTIRAAIMIGKVMKLSGSKAVSSDKSFVQSCVDILDSEVENIDKKKDAKGKMAQLVKEICK